MKIAIPTEENKWETNVANVFGRSKYFLVYDSELELHDFIENIGSKSAHGAGTKAAQQVINLKVDAVILSKIGKNGSDLLEAAGIKLYKNLLASVEVNINALKKSELPLLNE